MFESKLMFSTLPAKSARSFEVKLSTLSVHQLLYNSRYLSYFDHQQKSLSIEGNLKIIVYKDRKTPKR